MSVAVGVSVVVSATVEVSVKVEVGVLVSFDIQLVGNVAMRNFATCHHCYCFCLDNTINVNR